MDSLPTSVVVQRLARVGLFIFCCVSAGCQSQSRTPVPTTYPATGVVSFADGRPVQGASIEFRSADQAHVTITAVTQRDGKFSLHTLVDERKLDGAPQGKYQVFVMLPPKGQQVRSMELSDSYEVKAAENHFKIQITEEEQ